MLTIQKKSTVLPAEGNSLAKKKSLIAIDIVRGVAALGVFGYHQQIGKTLASYLQLPWLNILDAFGASYAVPLFFLLSGYCIHLSNIKYVKDLSPLPLITYYKRRLLRIYPPYLSALLISIAVHKWVNGDHYTSGDLFSHIFLLQGFSNVYFNSINVVLWTISVELALYILYPAFYYIRTKYSLIKALAFSGIISGLSIIYFSMRAEITVTGQYFVLNMWFAWCCGAYIADLNTLDKQALNTNFHKLAYVAIFGLFILFRFNYQPHFQIIDYQVKILVWILPLLLIINAEKKLSSSNFWPVKLLAAVGLSSYSLYLLHEPLIILKNYVVHTFLPLHFQALGIASGVILIPVICWLHYLVIEKPFIAQRKTTGIG